MTLQSLTSTDWQVLYDRLLKYALGVLHVATDRDRALPLGRQAQDVVQQAIEAVLNGRRTWNDDLDAYMQFAGIVRSEISNLRTSKEAGVLKTLPFGEEDGVHGAFDPPSTEDLLEDLIHSDCLDVLSGFINSIAARSDTLDNYRVGLEEGMQPAEIAEFFSIPVEDVYQARKTFMRRLTPLVAEHPCWQH